VQLARLSQPAELTENSFPRIAWSWLRLLPLNAPTNDKVVSAGRQLVQMATRLREF
jgi:hypothetical protein